jgi:hypothetical protein
MLDVDMHCASGRAFTPSRIYGAFVVNAKGYSLWQDNASDVTGGLVINSETDWRN